LAPAGFLLRFGMVSSWLLLLLLLLWFVRVDRNVCMSKD
jgi:hypothetical protein